MKMQREAVNMPDADSPDVAIEARPATAGKQQMFEIRFNKDPGTVYRQAGADAREAWALFCDRRKEWPSPHHATVTPVRG